MTDDLIAFVRQQLDEDERVAREALHPDAVNPGAWITEHHQGNPLTCHIAEDRTGHYWSVAHQVYVPNAEHMARWDPARVLADVKAKRLILDAYEQSLAPYAYRPSPYDVKARDLTDGLGMAVRLLAQPYADRPGWREEWRA